MSDAFNSIKEGLEEAIHFVNCQDIGTRVVSPSGRESRTISPKSEAIPMQKRTFVTGGPVVPRKNYFVSRETELADFLERIRQGKYVVIFAPRQTGKTTFFFRALEQLVQDASYIPISLDFQIYSDVSQEVFYRHFMQEIRLEIKRRLEKTQPPRYSKIISWIDQQNITDHVSLGDFFLELHTQLPSAKVVIIIDEFDGIPQEALRNFLYTLREIYIKKQRSDEFNYIHSVGIVGVKSIAQLDFDHSISPFNIQDGFALDNFSLEQVAELYGQYTAEVGQTFAPEVIEAVHHHTRGQPFLVNRLGQLLTDELGIDKTETITLEHFDTVYAQFFNDNNTHFQHLRRNIKRKPAFKRVLNRILFDDREVQFNLKDDLISELNTYGIVRADAEGVCVIDSPIYQEIIIKSFKPAINGVEDYYLSEDSDSDFENYLSDTGEVQMEPLLENFSDFIGRAGHRILEVPQTPQEFIGQYLLFAYLDLFVRQIGGHLYAEVRTGRGRLDLIVLYREQKEIVETKIWRGERRYQKGKRQLAEYLELKRMKRGYYVAFDHREKPETRRERENVDGKEIVSYCIPIPTE